MSQADDVRLPGWKQLLARPRGDLGAPNDLDVRDLAHFYVDAFGRRALLDHVRTRLGVQRAPGALHHALARVPAAVNLTTNFDRLLGRAMEEARGVPPSVIILDCDVGLIDEAQQTTVVKHHGCLSMPQEIVPTREDFAAYADRHRALLAYPQALLAARIFLFIGFSLTDPNFRAVDFAIRQALGAYRRTAYALGARPKPAHETRHWQE
jgi:hypothetical protein